MKAFAGAILYVIILSSTVWAINYSGVESSTLANSSPILVGRLQRQYTRPNNRFLWIPKHRCPRNRTPDISVSIKSLLPLIVINNTTYFDPWAGVTMRVVEYSNHYRIYLAVKTINDHILGCDPPDPGPGDGCRTCTFCDYCPGTAGQDPNCNDRLRAIIEVLRLCR